MEIKYDKAQFQKILDNLDAFAGSKARTIFKNAFNRAGFSTRNRIIEQDMGQIFNNPNSYTKNSLLFKQVNASGGNITGGTLEFKKKSGGGVGAGIYLMPEEWGGSRMLKGFELRLKRMGMLPDGMFAVPTISYPKSLRNPATLNKLANDLGKGVTRVASGKKTRGAKYDQYFVLTTKRQGLEPGIYLRVGRKVIRLFAFVDKVTYKQIFGFYARATRYFTEFFKSKLDDEMQKAFKP